MPEKSSVSSDAPTQLEQKRDELVKSAKVQATTAFDFVIVGSGAGGGPLAARLAREGKRVLVIEAGQDPNSAPPEPGCEPGEVNQAPGYHAAATEDQHMSWQFSVRHFHDDAQQAMDAKYNQSNVAQKYRDPSPPPAGAGKRGIFYPRSAGIGGCTGHHAMIMITPNDRDWDRIADLTGDDSWRAQTMRGYFARLEKCLYPEAYNRFLKKLLGVIYRIWRYLVLLFSPRSVLDNGGHGQKGWQPTSLINPNLVASIAGGDPAFLNVLVRTALTVLHGKGLKALLKTILFQFRLVQALDPNDLNTRRVNRNGGVYLIPLGTAGDDPDSKDEIPPEWVGRRIGVREHLLKTQEDCPENLVILTGYHVTRVIFAEGTEGTECEKTPRAIGVEAVAGDHLYEASPLQKSPPTERVCFFTRGEVVLCGGAFNTPQLLMLSGIGDTKHLEEIETSAGDAQVCTLRGDTGQAIKAGTKTRVHLPGVGCNLQDRYEVTVVSDLDEDFSTLKEVTFKPGDINDKAREQWLRAKKGLYTTNGGAIAIMRRTSAAGSDDPPDTFTFGAPAAFRGYYWGWSRELLRPTLGSTDEKRNLWSWVILKAYTSNSAGTVRLRSADPFACPDVCFDSFNEAAQKAAPVLAMKKAACEARGEPVPPALLEEIATGQESLAASERDLNALVDMVKFIREVNAKNPAFRNEIQPGEDIQDDTDKLKNWIKTQTWGHHASCTCRIGSDQWQADPDNLTDRKAVLDSRFRVHGVRGLRVVDASVFPYIPGYFILTPIFIMSEKAAATLLEDSADEVYPAKFRREEARAIARRREVAQPRGKEQEEQAPTDGLPAETVGLAISGGGIRSATFALGFLQALARKKRLRKIDILSTVSGGGFIGSFLGRLFTRPMVTNASDPSGRAEEILSDTNSSEIWWLRTQANYIFATGKSDFWQDVAAYLRNVFTVHIVIGSLLFAILGTLRAVAPHLPQILRVAPPALNLFGLPLSEWWWLPVAALLVGILPASLGYWLAPRPGINRPYPVYTLVAWTIVIFGFVFLTHCSCAISLAIIVILVLMLAWVWQEVARWGKPKTDNSAVEELNEGPLVRSRLTNGLGEVIMIFGILVVWTLIDTLTRAVAEMGYAVVIAKIVVALAPVLPLLQWLAQKAVQESAAGTKKSVSFTTIGNIIGVPLALFLLFALNLVTYRLFMNHDCWAGGLVIIAFLFSLAVGRGLTFLNLSSLCATYAARLGRTFQGATNPSRIYSEPTDSGRDVGEAHPMDDIPWSDYHPEHFGGPLHLVNVTLNETLDYASGREVRERKGLPMCVGPLGVSVGRRYFGRWTEPSELSRWQKWRRRIEGVETVERGKPTALEALPVDPNPNAFNVFGTPGERPAPVESLTLGTWTAISGAAFNTGIGRATTLPLAFLTGLVNLRLGYWWDTGLMSWERPGRYPLSLWGKLKHLPNYLFPMQMMLLSEWRGLFPGPWERFWYLSDGGHFDVTGLYELLRRRVPLMIVTDGGEDSKYHWDDISQVMREARIDFGAEITWVTRKVNNDPWGALSVQPPPWIQEWIDPARIAELSKISRDGEYHAALARVTYDSDRSVECWLLLIKPSLTKDLPQDVLNHAVDNGLFPQDPTYNQVFDDITWESYRALGEAIGDSVLRPADPKVKAESNGQ